jgi:hypothetical protein
MPINRRVRFEVFKRDGFACRYCGRKAPDVALEVDHIRPRSKGGDDGMRNLRTACYDCNAGKSNVPLESYSPSRGIRGLLMWPSYRLRGGPVDGQRLRPPHALPFIWVMRGTDDGLCVQFDEWVTDARGRRLDRVRYGHPHWTAGDEEYEVIGAYAIAYPGDDDLRWCTQYQLLTRFTEPYAWQHSDG